MDFLEENELMFPPLQDLLLVDDDDDKSKQAHERDENSNRVKSIEEITGYRFNDPILLKQAFTHHSYEEEEAEGGACSSSSLQRLAYVGDSVLSFLIAKEHYVAYPDLDPGKLTRLRAVNVDTEKFARVALKHNLHKFLRHNIILLGVQLKEFRNEMMEYPLHSSGLIDAPKILADIVESFIGAIFIDSNSSIHTTWKIAKKLLEPIITPAELPTHPVTQLRELCQRKGFTVKIRDFWRETGEIEVIVDEEIVGRAKYKAKRVIAKNRASLDAYKQILEKYHNLEEN